MVKLYVNFVVNVFVLVALSACVNIEKPLVPAQLTHYIVKNVNVIDVVNRQVKAAHSVEVKQGIITNIHANYEALAKDGVTSIDGSGKYLIPGLWDNHSTVLNVSPEMGFPLYIANGVTSIRSNLSCPNENESSIYACHFTKGKWKNLIEKGEMVGPSIQGWGTFPINGSKKLHPDSPSFHGGGTSQDANLIALHYASFEKKSRPFFIKTYNNLPIEGYLALAKTAQRNGFELSGHKPKAVTIEQLVNAGQRSVAHARLFLYDCSSESKPLNEGKHWKQTLPDFYQFLLSTFDQEKCQSRYQLMADKQVFLNPTLMTRRNDYYAVAGLTEKMKGLKYAHYLMHSEWKEDVEKLGTNLTSQDIQTFKDFYLKAAETVYSAHQAGVPILAGTDSWSEYNVPGFSLHEELKNLSAAGLDNFSVLQAATINGAYYFRIADKVGSIDVGKRSDMVLLADNPLKDIANTESIVTVFKGDRVYSKQILDKLKIDVENLAGSHKVTMKLIGMMLQNPTGF